MSLSEKVINRDRPIMLIFSHAAVLIKFTYYVQICMNKSLLTADNMFY